jgi:hypothetical protein
MKDPKNPSGFYRDVAPWMLCICPHPHGSICECTGKLTEDHIEECSGCALCEGDK